MNFIIYFFYCLILLALPDGDSGQVRKTSPSFWQPKISLHGNSGQVRKTSSVFGQPKISLRSLPKNVSSALVRMILNSGQAPWAIEQKIGQIARPEVLRNWNVQSSPKFGGVSRRDFWGMIGSALAAVWEFIDIAAQELYFLVSWMWTPRPEYYYHKDTTRQMCYIMQQTYRSSLHDVHRYSELRQWYTNSAEFEIGYFVHEIIFKYELMIEIYDLVYKQYTKNVTRNYTPIPYMLEMYRNILEHASDVLHLTRLLHEVEEKYIQKRQKYVQRSLWSDYDDNEDDPEKLKLTRDPKIASINRGVFVDVKKLIEEKEAFEKKKRKQRRKRIAKLRKHHKTWMKNSYRDYSTHKAKSWDFYGWSIEEW